MTEYKYNEKQNKFTESGHTMFEKDVLKKLIRLAYLETVTYALNKTEVKSLSYNWHQTGNLEMGLDFACDYVEVGKLQDRSKRLVVNIKEHTPSNGLEKHFADIMFEDGGITRVFNLTEIEYSN